MLGKAMIKAIEFVIVIVSFLADSKKKVENPFSVLS